MSIHQSSCGPGFDAGCDPSELTQRFDDSGELILGCNYPAIATEKITIDVT